MALCWQFGIKPYRVDLSPANSHRECHLSLQGKDAQAHLNNAIINHNGDLSGWSLWQIQGVLHYKRGDIPGAKRAYQEALRLNPTFKPAQNALKQIAEVQKYKYIQVLTK